MKLRKPSTYSLKIKCIKQTDVLKKIKNKEVPDRAGDLPTSCKEEIKTTFLDIYYATFISSYSYFSRLNLNVKRVRSE